MLKTVDYKFFKKALKIITPMVLSQVVIVAISFVDGIMVNGYNRGGLPPGVSKVDYEAVGLAGELWFAFQAPYAAAVILFSIIYSQFANNKKVFTDTAKINIWFSSGQTILISFIMFFAAEPLVNLFFLSNAGDSESITKPIAVNYFKILSLGQIFLSLCWAILNPLTIKGKTKYALYLSLISLFLNFGLDYIFIYVFDLGAEGSAWATDIAYGIEFLLAIFILLKHRSFFDKLGNLFSINKKVLKELLKRIMIFLTFIFMQVGLAASTVLYSNLYGSDYIKPIMVGYTVSSILFTIFAGINRGIKVFIGPLLGDGKFDEAKIVAKKLLWPNLFLSFIFIIIALISSTFFPASMLDNSEYISLAKNMTYIFAIALLIYVISSYYSAILETSGFQLLPNILSYFFQVWAITPAIFLFSPLLINCSISLNFLITQSIYLIPAIVFYIVYKQKKWLRKIKI